ncbi:MAG: riboflavin biosynthesis protein RibF [Opitutales bacterium]|nr:riboflavin biosynthesis protein RibF [Opitutales bacterium]
MSPLPQATDLAAAVWPPGPLHLAIGMFDGVHRGHRAVIMAAVQAAQRSGGVAAVLTFAPHPSVLFRPHDPTRMILDAASKARVLQLLGVHTLIVQPFTPEFAAVAAGDFVPWLRQRAPQLAALYAGENFRFGQGRTGDITQLVAEGQKHGLAVYSAPRVQQDGEPIRSTRSRALLEGGEVAAANTLLGYTYFTDGPVVPGKRPALRPRFVVYVVRVVSAKASAPLPGVANYGLRPTVEQTTRPLLEAHVLGDCPFGAGDTVTVTWRRFLRPEQKFSGVEELRAQIARDQAAAAADFSLR